MRISSSLIRGFPRIRSMLIWFGIGIGILLFILWFYPKGLALAYEIHGGYLLDQAVQADPGFRGDDFLCPVDPSDHEVSREMASEAKEWVTKAVTLNPRLSHGYLLLGRANCILGEYENAKIWFGTFSDLRPENPLGQLEFGLASLALDISNLTQESNITCLTDYDPGAENDDSIVSLLAQIRNTGYESIVLERIGNKYFFQKEYHAAFCVYQLMDTLELKMDPKAHFFAYLSTKLSQPSLPENSSIIPFIYQLSEDVLIEGSNLQWIVPLRVTGQRLGEDTSPNTEPGVMWWDGSAVAIVDVVSPGMFQVTVRAQNSSPPPVELQLEHNMEPIMDFSLNKGDLSWEELEKDIYLNEGLNFIGIRFINDGLVNERDRNAYIQWIKLKRKG